MSIIRTWHVGAQNDALFIYHGEAPALNNDYPDHDADREVIAGPFEAHSERMVDNLKKIVLFHNTQIAEIVNSASRDIKTLKDEISDGYDYMEDFVREHDDPGTGALAWLARNHEWKPLRKVAS